MNESEPKPGDWQRLAVASAILLAVVVLGTSVVIVVDDLRRLVVQGPLLLAAIVGAWYALTRGGGRRVGGVVVAVAAAAGIVIIGYVHDRTADLASLWRLVLLVLGAALARFALGRDRRSLRASATPGVSVPAATHGALMLNLRSGGGKAERLHLVDECQRRGIEPVVLRPGDDLSQLARDAIDRGVDVVGMAGGDGSQARVAAVAAERGVPMVVVPAGTRNHLALDLGLDRDDVVGALDAFCDAVERPMDLAEVNGRVFVNNVSLGLYATIVRSPEYRNAKVDTTLATLPKVFGPGSRPFDLRFTGPGGTHHDGVHLIQISNNPYGNNAGTRPRLDTKRLGVIALEIDDGRAAAAFLAAIAGGHPERFAGFASWTAETFKVTSGSAIDIGLDGEALTLDPPLSFSIRTEPLRVRLPRHAIGSSPAARAVGWRSATGGCGAPPSADSAASNDRRSNACVRQHSSRHAASPASGAGASTAQTRGSPHARRATPSRLSACGRSTSAWPTWPAASGI